MTSQTLPFGSWPSPVSADDLVASGGTPADPGSDGGLVHWLRTTPETGSRVILSRREADGSTTDLSPEWMSVRSRVHEYGGGRGAPRDGVVVGVDFTTQRLWRLDGEPRALTPETPDAAVRWAAPAVDPVRGVVFVVREDHRDGDLEPVNEVCGCRSRAPRIRRGGRARRAARLPRPRRRRLRRPRPARLRRRPRPLPRRRPAGLGAVVAPGDAVGRRQRAGRRPGRGRRRHRGATRRWWRGPDRHRAGLGRRDPPGLPRRPGRVRGAPRRRRDRPRRRAHRAGPGRHRVGAPGVGVPHPGPDPGRRRRLVGARTVDGIIRLSAVTPSLPGAVTDLDLPLVAGSGLAPHGDGLVLDAGHVDLGFAACTVTLPAEAGSSASLEVVAPRGTVPDPAYVAAAEPVSWTGHGGATAHGFLHRPTHPEVGGPEGELPPLVVVAHGGPTSATHAVPRTAIAWFTSRGIAVLDVNYAGSTGYGRAYRSACAAPGASPTSRTSSPAPGTWPTPAWWTAPGWACAGARRRLRRVRGARLPRRVQRGCELLRRLGPVAAGAGDPQDGVALPRRPGRAVAGRAGDLRGALAAAPRRGHPRPAAAAPGRRRPGRAALAGRGHDRRLRELGRPVALEVFAGEGHGFRDPANIVRAAELELSFLGQVWGFDPAGDLPAVDLQHDGGRTGSRFGRPGPARPGRPRLPAWPRDCPTAPPPPRWRRRPPDPACSRCRCGSCAPA